MTPLANPFKKQRSLAELEEATEQRRAENELMGTELSIAQKREAIRRLKARGLTPKHFGGDFMKIVKWLKEH